MSPGIECLRQEAAAANSNASESGIPVLQPVDQAGGERVASPDPVDDVCRLHSVVAIMKACRLCRQADQPLRSALRLSRKVMAWYFKLGKAAITFPDNC